MRILIVTFDPPQNVGGVEGRAVHYTRELTAMGHSVKIASFAPGQKVESESFNGGVLYKLPSSVSAIPGSVSFLMQTARRDSIESVFLLSGGLTAAGISILAFARLLGMRTATFFYGKDILSVRGRVASLLIPLIGMASAKIVVNSRFTRGLLPAWMAGNAKVLYPGIDPTATDGVSEGQPRSYKTVLFVGRLVKRKGIDALLSAFKLVLEQVPETHLEIVGDGPERETIRSIIKVLGLEKNVEMTRALRGRALYERFARADLFVMAPRSSVRDVEGFGTVFLEAGLFSKPVIGSLSGGVPEAVEDGVTGYLVKEGDLAQLSGRMLELLTERETSARMGAAGRRRAIQEFSWSEGARRLLDVLAQ